MEIVEVANTIKETIEAIRKTRSALKIYAKKKSQKESEYNKKLALTIMGLKHGEIFEVEGKKVEGAQATIVKDLAKGICWKELLERDEAEALYKTCIVGIQSLQAELNGLQSIYRNLDTQ